MLRHHAPFGDHGFAHLAGILRAGDLVDPYRDFLADEAFQLRGLRVVLGDELKSLATRLPIVPERKRMAFSSPDSTSPALIGLPGFGAGSPSCAGSACCACATGATSATARIAAQAKRMPNRRFVISISSVVVS